MVLAILQSRPGYGYRIIKRIHDLTDGDIGWTTGTLYPFLHGLENQGVVRSYWTETEDGPRRKYYSLTPAGERELEHEKAQWARVHKLLSQLFNPQPGLLPG